MFLITNMKAELNRFLRKNYISFFPILVFTVFQLSFWLLNLKGWLELSKVDHNALLTINLTLAGFLLTGIGIMVSIRDKAFIQVLIKMGYWQKIEHSVFLGIAAHILSALLSLLNLITKLNSIIVFNVETISFMLGITYFIIVVIWLKKALKYI
jgi:hypothetical protein